MEVSAGIEVDMRLARKLVGGLVCVSFPPMICGVTVVVLLSLLIRDAFEMVLVFKMLAAPTAEERRDVRDGVSDCAEDSFKDIVTNTDNGGGYPPLG
jgi:hypothetical protein